MRVSVRDFGKEILLTLMQQKKRSALTLFGVFWGVMLLALMLAAGMGFEGGMLRQLVEVESNCVALTAAPTSIAWQGLESGREWHFDDDDIASLNVAFPGVIRNSVPISHFPDNFALTPLSSDDNFLLAPAVGVTPDFPDIIPQKIIAGRSIDKYDCDSMRKVCVLGENPAKSLYGTPANATGKDLKIGSNVFKVVGVVRESNPVMNFGVKIAEDIFIPITTGGFIFDRIGEYDTIVNVLNEEFSPADYTGKFGDAARRRHKISPDDIPALTILDLNDYYGMFTALLKAFRALIWVIGTGTLLTGLIGISNIMMISVFERSNEIGIRLSFGATASSITAQIMCESLALALTGGMAGFLAGGWCVHAISGLVEKMESTIIANVHVPFWPMIAALAILVAGGLAAGYFPAKRAMEINIIDTLRDE